MPGLLVSVRSVSEAAAALAGGADIIDVKEPAHGSLGRADDGVVAEVLAHVAGRRPVSAARGELVDNLASRGCPPVADAPGSPRLSFVKWGLAGCRDVTSWPEQLQKRRTAEDAQLVYVAYADWQCAQAPAVDDVVALACREPGNIVLIDTHCKDAATLRKDRRPTLLDWMSVEEVESLCRRCHDADVRIALAGSLGRSEIETLTNAAPDWFAVRGAVCEEGSRQGSVRVERVRELASIVGNVCAKSR